MVEKNTTFIIVGIVVLFILFSGSIDLGSFTIFPEKPQADFWELIVTDQNGLNVYNEGDSLKVSALLSAERIAEAAYFGATPDRLISGSGNCFYPTRGADVYVGRCPTPDAIFNNINYQEIIGEPNWINDPWGNPDWYDTNYKTGRHDCGPHVFVDDKLCGYDPGACESLTPGFHEVEYLGWFEPMAGSDAKYYCPSREMYLSTEIYVIPDPCELTVDQALVLEGPFTEPFSNVDLSHSVDKYCSRFAPLVFNSKLGFAYDDIALERFYKLTSGETITPTGYEEIFVFYVTSDFGILCTGEDEVYDINSEQCVKPSQLLNVIRCSEGTLEIQADGSVLCIKQGEIFIKCEAGATFDQEIQRCVIEGETTIICPTGSTLDESIDKCIIEGETELTCTEGVWDELLQKCLVEGEIGITCPTGVWGEDQQKCIVEGDISYFCSKGYYDITLDKCILGKPNEPSPTPTTTSTTIPKQSIESTGFAGVNLIIIVFIIGLVLFYVLKKK